MTALNDDKELERIVKKDQSGITPEDVSLLARSLIPSSSKSTRSLAFLALSKLSQGLGTAQNGKSSVVSSVQSYFETIFSDIDDEVENCVPLVYLLSALFALAPAPAIALLTTRISPRGTTDDEDVPDVLDILLDSAELPSPLQPALAELLGQAASTKAGREAVSRAETWLRVAIDYGTEPSLGALCAVALSKLVPSEPKAGEHDSNARIVEELGLAKRMMDHIASGSDASVVSTLEGLSILSTKGHVKHLLATTSPFLKALLALSPVPSARPSSMPVTPRASIDIDEKIFEPVETSLCYGVTTILVNLTNRKPILSAEDEQLAKLRAMAVSGKKGAEVPEDPFKAEEAVEERVKAVFAAGVIPALRGLGRAESVLVKETLGRLCLNIVYDKAHRSAFVRDGGFKVLSSVVRDLLSPKRSTSNGTAATDSSRIDYLPSVQALAKMIITTPPHLLFPPPHQTTAVNALTPLYHLLSHPSSLLQTFEALMALTNLATIDPSFANRIVGATITPPVDDTMWRGSGRDDKIKIITRIEELLLDSNTLVRRAATELVCNLVNSPSGHAHFAGESGSTDASARVESRLNVLLVLTSIDDTPTRLAAGGSLAIISESPQAAAALLAISDETSNRSTWTRVLGLLEGTVPETDEEGEDIPVISSTPPNPDLVHRAVIILLNLVEYASQMEARRQTILTEARAAGVEGKVMSAVRANMNRREIIEPAVELLKLLKQYPA